MPVQTAQGYMLLRVEAYQSPRTAEPHGQPILQTMVLAVLMYWESLPVQTAQGSMLLRMEAYQSPRTAEFYGQLILLPRVLEVVM